MSQKVRPAENIDDAVLGLAMFSSVSPLSDLEVSI